MEIDTSVMSLQQHPIDCHPEQEGKLKWTFEFIIPKPGPGRIEINMAKVLLDVAWVPVISRSCALLAFRSQNAQLVVKTGSIHHHDLFCHVCC